MNLEWRKMKDNCWELWELAVYQPGTEDHEILMARVTHVGPAKYDICWWESVDGCEMKQTQFEGSQEKAKAYAAALVRLA